MLKKIFTSVENIVSVCYTYITQNFQYIKIRLRFTTNMNKNDLRKIIKTKIGLLCDKAERSKIICEKALSLTEISNVVSVGVFLSTEYEPDTSFLIEKLQNSYSVYAPKIFGSEMKFFKLDKDTLLTKNKFGIYEPSENEEQEDFSIIFVPLVAFDSKNNRLGHGCGYYDKFLLNKSALKVGLAFSCQEVDLLNTEKHDVPLDIIIHA